MAVTSAVGVVSFDSGRALSVGVSEASSTSGVVAGSDSSTCMPEAMETPASAMKSDATQPVLAFVDIWNQVKPFAATGLLRIVPVVPIGNVPMIVDVVPAEERKFRDRP